MIFFWYTSAPACPNTSQRSPPPNQFWRSSGNPSSLKNQQKMIVIKFFNQTKTSCNRIFNLITEIISSTVDNLNILEPNHALLLLLAKLRLNFIPKLFKAHRYLCERYKTLCTQITRNLLENLELCEIGVVFLSVLHTQHTTSIFDKIIQFH